MKAKLFFPPIIFLLIILTPVSCSKIIKEGAETGMGLLAKEEAKTGSELGVKSLAKSSTRKKLASGLKNSRIKKVAKATTLTSRRLFVTEKNQFITYKAFQQWLEIPANRKRLLLGRPKEGRVLRENLRMTMGAHYDKYAKSTVYQAHHLIAADGSYPSSKVSQKVLKKFQIDINDPMNGIILPKNGESIYFGTYHNGSHIQKYHDLVANRLKSAKTREECMAILDVIKRDLYKGRIELYKTHKANTLGSPFKNLRILSIP